MPDIRISEWGNNAIELANTLNALLDGHSAGMNAIALSLVLLAVLRQSPVELRPKSICDLMSQLEAFIGLMETVGRYAEQPKNVPTN